jgi:hypothetical protein
MQSLPEKTMEHWTALVPFIAVRSAEQWWPNAGRTSGSHAIDCHQTRQGNAREHGQNDRQNYSTRSSRTWSKSLDINHPYNAEYECFQAALPRRSVPYRSHVSVRTNWGRCVRVLTHEWRGERQSDPACAPTLSQTGRS